MDAEVQDYLNNLVIILSSRFDKQELATICFKTGIEVENLSGDTLVAKARELVKFLEHHQRLPELIEQVKKDRPDVKLPVSPWVKTELIAAARQLERNQAYTKAIEKWEEIQTLDASNVHAEKEIDRLKDKVKQNAHIVDLKFRLSARAAEISIYIQVLTRLKRMEK